MIPAIGMTGKLIVNVDLLATFQRTNEPEMQPFGSSGVPSRERYLSEEHKMVFDLAVAWWELVLSGVAVYLITLSFLRLS